MLQGKKVWHNKNKEKVSIKVKKWVKNNQERDKENYKEWQNNNKDKIKEYNKNRQHKNHKITIQEWESCKTYFVHRCAYCGLPIEEHYINRKGVVKLGDFHKEHVDHFGKGNLQNCVPSCRTCNSRKWKYNMEEWYRQQEFFSEEKLNKIYQWINTDYKVFIK